LSRSQAAGRRSRSPAPTPRLSDLDLRILALLSRHRVLTQNQLAALHPGTPIRTLRYRCARLAREGLAGRTRPYRERGSAPTTSGRPAGARRSPTAGRRREPNPLFLRGDQGRQPRGDLPVPSFARGSTTGRVSAPSRIRTCGLLLRREGRGVTGVYDGPGIPLIEPNLRQVCVVRRSAGEAEGPSSGARGLISTALWREATTLDSALLPLTPHRAVVHLVSRASEPPLPLRPFRPS
jgi:hypothetical protein